MGLTQQARVRVHETLSITTTILKDLYNTL